MVDTLKTPETPLLHDGLVQHPRFPLPFTPTSPSWLNLVAGWFSLPSRRRLTRGRSPARRTRKAAIRARIAATNAHPKPFVRTKSADAVSASLARSCR